MLKDQEIDYKEKRREGRKKRKKEKDEEKEELDDEKINRKMMAGEEGSRR